MSLWGTAEGNAMPDQGFDPATYINATSSHMQSAPEMPSKIFKPPCPPFATQGKRQCSHCRREWNMRLPPLFPRPPVTENIRERAGAGRAALHSSPRPCAAAGQAAAPQREAPPPPPPQPDGPRAHRRPGRTRAATTRAEHGGAVPGRTGQRSARPRRRADPDPPPNTDLPPGPAGPASSGRHRKCRLLVSPWEPGTPRQPLCSHLGTGGRQQSLRGSRAFRTRRC